MPQEQLRIAIDALRARLQEELESQLASLTERQEQAIEAARRAAESEAEHRWTAKVDAVRAEWMARLESEVAGARADAERRFVTEAARLRSEADEAAAQAAAKVRAEMEKAAQQAAAQMASRLRAEAEQAAALAAVRVREEAEQEIENERHRALALLDAERARSSADLEAERQRATAALDAERQRVEAERQAERQRFEADRVSERQRLEAERQQFRSERQRFEVERQQFAIERDRFEAAGEEHEAARQIAEHLQADVRRLESELAGERQQLQKLKEALQHANESRQPSEQLQADVRRLESELAGERQQGQKLKDALKHANESLQRAQAALEEERQARLAIESVPAPPVPVASDAATVTEARAAERDLQLAIVERLFGAMRAMDTGRSLTDILSTLVEAAGAEAPRAALFIASGERLQGYKARGFQGDIAAERPSTGDGGLFGEVMRTGEAIATSEETDVEAPAFAALARGRAAIAVPISIGGEPVAVLYADDGSAEEETAPASWPEAVQILASHAAVCLAHLTAARTAEAMQLMAGPAPSDAESSAKRYARLLVAEIKLYNEAAVRAGRENRDLLDRLRPEIERARKLYEERIPTEAGLRQSFFHQELVQTLAEGDAALLGEPV